MNEKNKKKRLIVEYVDEEDCNFTCEQELFNCDDCNKFGKCHAKSEIEYNDDDNDVFVELVNYGGYETAEDFWNELFE